MSEQLSTICLLKFYKDWKDNPNSNSEKLNFTIIKQSDNLTKVLKGMTVKWLLFIDSRMILKENATSVINNYLTSVEENVKVIVDQNLWLPILIEKEWLLQRINQDYRITDLVEFNILIRDEYGTELMKVAWPILSSTRPTVKERYKHMVLNRWWSTYQYDYIAKRYSVENQCNKFNNDNLFWEDLSENLAKYYDIVIVEMISSILWENFLASIVNTNTLIATKGEYLYLTYKGEQQLNDGQMERSLEQGGWFLFIKDQLAKQGFFVRNIGTGKNHLTYAIYQHISQIKIKKRQKVNFKNKLAILIDMPGIGDAVRLTSLLPGIKNKFPDNEIFLVVNVKANIIYQQNRNITEIFVCSLRPDPPIFNYIIPGLLSDLLLTKIFDNVVSLAWDTTAYFNNVKKNFIKVYADLAGIKGKIKPEINIGHEAQKTVDRILTASKIDLEKLTIGIQFGASMESKSFSEIKAIDFIEKLLMQIPEVQILNLDYRKIEHDKILNIGEYLGIKEFIAVIGKCDFFVGVDSAGGHVAAALMIPAITIYGKEKPRIGNDHRPISDINIGIIPAEDCECPEYTIDCPKDQKCIDSIEPGLIMYALEKSINLKYYKGIKTINVNIAKQILWQSGQNLQNFNNISSLKDKRNILNLGLKIDVNDLVGEKLAFVYLNKEKIKVSNSSLGIDIFIAKDVFKYASYGTLKVVIDNGEKMKITLRTHRLHEGWNLLRFPLTEDSYREEFKKLTVYLNAQKVLSGVIFINSIYMVNN